MSRFTPVAVTGNSFVAQVIASDRPVIVHVYAPWCEPAKALAKTLENIGNRYGDRIKVCSANVTLPGNDELINAFNIRSLELSWLLFFKNQVVRWRRHRVPSAKHIDTTVGILSESEIAERLDRILGHRYPDLSEALKSGGPALPPECLDASPTGCRRQVAAWRRRH